MALHESEDMMMTSDDERRRAKWYDARPMTDEEQREIEKFMEWHDIRRRSRPVRFVSD
jgi:hypothetical protein